MKTPANREGLGNIFQTPCTSTIHYRNIFHEAGNMKHNVTFYMAIIILTLLLLLLYYYIIYWREG